MQILRGVATVLLIAMASPALAGNWVVCEYDVKAVNINSSKRELQVKILKGRHANVAECPAVVGEMSFTPETVDYQSELPRKYWPRVGQRARLRYRHLDGYCKNTGPCRIKHYSIMPAR